MLNRVFADDEVSPGALDASIYADFPYNRHRSPKVHAMVDFFVERIGEAPDWDIAAA